MKAEGMEKREDFDRVFHFVESYSITGHFVPLASIRLFGPTHMHTYTHMLTMCEIHGRTYRGPFVFACIECAGEETPDRPPCHRLLH